MEGIIESILISESAGGEVVSQSSVMLEIGRGIVGDRYYLSKGTYSRKLYDAAAFRRNLVTRGIRLNDLVGKEFSIGDIKFRGVRLCEPCAYLADLLGPEFLDLMVHKAGLRAQILVDGSIELSDSICS